MSYKYKLPQQYNDAHRMEIILHELNLGHDFYQIGEMMGGVYGEAVKYHYKRYHLGIKPKKKQKPVEAFDKHKILYVRMTS